MLSAFLRLPKSEQRKIARVERAMRSIAPELFEKLEEEILYQSAERHAGRIHQLARIREANRQQVASFVENLEKLGSPVREW